MTNYTKYYFHTAFFQIALMFCTGTILQTFLLALGMSEKTIYLYNSVIQWVQVAVMFIAMFFIDKIQKSKNLLGYAYLAPILLLAALILAVALREDLHAVTVMIFIVSLFANIFIGFYTILSFRLPYEIIDMDNYGKLTGISTALSGAFAFLVSLIYTWVIGKNEYLSSVCGFFIAAILCVALSSFFCFALRCNTSALPQSQITRGINTTVFRDKKTWILAIPNFVRGFGYGVISLMTVVGFSADILTTQSSTYLSIALQIATFFGNIAFAFSYKKWTSGRLLLLSSVLLTIFLPLSVLRGAFWDFMIGYFLVQFFLIIMNTAVPTVVAEIIPYDEIGAFSSIRLMLYTAGSAVASLLINPISRSIGFFWLFVIAGGSELICGFGYYAVVAILKNRSRASCPENEAYSIHS